MTSDLFHQSHHFLIGKADFFKLEAVILFSSFLQQQSGVFIKKLQHKPLTKYRNRQVNPPIWGLPCLFFTCLPFSFAILAVWIQGALSRRSGNRCFRIARNKQIIRTRPPQGRTGSDYIGLVRMKGVEHT